MLLILLLVSCFSYWAAGKDSCPNIVLILTDDQDLILGGLTPMVKTQKLVSNEGATFANAFVTTPICCPSRSSILTGCYLHNHGTVNNSVAGGCSNTAWQQYQEKHSFAVHLHKAGYSTFYAGKYLNQYGKLKTGGPKHVPPGWDWWIGLVGNSRYYNYTLSLNGTAKHFTDDYLTDVIKNYGLEFLHHRQDANNCFLMVLAPPAPHAPFTPAPEYWDQFKHIRAMHTPNFNTSVHKDKHWLLRMKPSPLPTSILSTLDNVYRRRWETLLSVDDLVEAVIMQLKSLKLLSNTYVMFTTDHGYHIGQFGLPWDKRQPYESDIRVPLLIRGPGIIQKKLITDPVLNIDLAPTILEMAGLPPSENMDGQSFFYLLTHFSKSRGRIFLVEYEGEGDSNSVSMECPLPLDDNLAECSPEAFCKCEDSRNNTYTCIRHLEANHNFKYCRFNDFENFKEVYNLDQDPYELHNLQYILAEDIASWYDNVIHHLKSCSGKRKCYVPPKISL